MTAAPHGNSNETPERCRAIAKAFAELCDAYHLNSKHNENRLDAWQSSKWWEDEAEYLERNKPK